MYKIEEIRLPAAETAPANLSLEQLKAEVMDGRATKRSSREFLRICCSLSLTTGRVGDILFLQRLAVAFLIEGRPVSPVFIAELAAGDRDIDASRRVEFVQTAYDVLYGFICESLKGN